MIVSSEKPNIESGPHVLHTREPLQARRERIRHLVFDLLRTAAHPVGIDEHLVFREIGNRVHGRLEHRRTPSVMSNSAPQKTRKRFFKLHSMMR